MSAGLFACPKICGHIGKVFVPEKTVRAAADFMSAIKAPFIFEPMQKIPHHGCVIAHPRSGLLRSLSRLRKPIHSPSPFRTARLTSSAPSRETMMRSPRSFVGQDIKQTSSALVFPVGEIHPRLRGRIRACASAFITRSTPIAIAAVRCETLSLWRV